MFVNERRVRHFLTVRLMRSGFEVPLVKHCEFELDSYQVNIIVTLCRDLQFFTCDRRFDVKSASVHRSLFYGIHDCR
jgi:hypothetical protein